MTEAELIVKLVDALYSALNVEGAAIAGAQTPAFQGLDVVYHFDKIRDAIAEAENFQECEERDFDGDYMSDAEADADVLRMAGMGTDEDYGHFGDLDERY